MREKITDPKIAFQVSDRGSIYAQTKTLSSLIKDNLLNNLNTYDLYKWVNEDKPNRLPEVKEQVIWKTDIKRLGQNQISDMYSPSNNTYRFIKSELSLADSLIIDIDGGLPYSQFLEQYEDWTFLAYPSISNTMEDWNKYRVIFPLKHTIQLKGEYNLRVLKVLRMFFCRYEDPNHQLYSFVNMNDFVNMKTNQGYTLDIPQEIVNDITIAISQSMDYTAMKKADKKRIYGELKDFYWSLEKAQNEWKEVINDPTEGIRHPKLFVIKNNLSEEDCQLFEKWLVDNYPEKYFEKWKSHKKLS